MLACIAGVLLGGGVNMAIVVVGASIIPPPQGVDITNSDLLEPMHFAAPFLAHALGTLAGSFVAFLLAATSKSVAAYVVGAVFLAGGIAASFMISAPVWFIALDLCAAYIPMSYLGIHLGRGAAGADAEPA